MFKSDCTHFNTKMNGIRHMNFTKADNLYVTLRKPYACYELTGTPVRYKHELVFSARVENEVLHTGSFVDSLNFSDLLCPVCS